MLGENLGFEAFEPQDPELREELGLPPETEEDPRAGLPGFLDLMRSAATTSGLDASVVNRASEGPEPMNGGARCDVSSGPCSCGAWH